MGGRNMKKGLLFCMLLAFALMLAACGNNDDGGGAADVPSTPTPTPTPQQAQDTDDEAEEEEEDRWTDERFAVFNEYFPPVDLGGITLRINFADPEDMADEFAQEIWRERRDWIQESFNITLEYNQAFYNAIEWHEQPTQLIASIAAGDPIFHLGNAINAAFHFPQLARADILIPGGGWIEDNFPPDFWNFVGEHNGTVYGFGVTPLTSTMGIIYNRDLIRQVGMEMTPSEMFIAGRWSHEDFYNYLSELQSLLPEGSYAIGLHPDHLQRGFAFANGGYFINPFTNVPGYLDESFLEGVRLQQRMIASGIQVGPGWWPEEDGAPRPGGQWSFAGGRWPATGTMFRDGEIAIGLGLRWEFEAISALFEFGFVPFPWGSNVQWPASGDWRDLKDYGYNSFVNDGGTSVLFRGTPSSVNHDIFARILFSYTLNQTYVNLRDAWRAGESSPFVIPGTNDLFEDIDKELWHWYASNPVWENILNVGGSGTFLVEWHQVLGNNTDPRPAFESVIGEHVWLMYDFGSIRLEDLPESVRIQAEEFGLWLSEQPDEEE
jgi:ABC-type glycerol-3-phosphate transport system substrate-binding protein